MKYAYSITLNTWLTINWSQTKEAVALDNLCGTPCNVSAETVNQELGVTPDYTSLHRTFLWVISLKGASTVEKHSQVLFLIIHLLLHPVGLYHMK